MRAVPVALFLLAMPLAGLFSGCSNEVTVDQKFVNLFVELRLAELNYGKDSPTARLARRDALKEAGYTREQFLAKTDEILENERLWVPFQKAVTARIDSLLEQPKPDSDHPAEPKKDSPEAVKKKLFESMKNMPAKKGGVGR